MLHYNNNMPETGTIIYAGVGIAALAAVVAVIVVFTNKKDMPPPNSARAMRAGSRAVDYDATASMWADEDSAYRRAAALDRRY